MLPNRHYVVPQNETFCTICLKAVETNFKNRQTLYAEIFCISLCVSTHQNSASVKSWNGGYFQLRRFLNSFSRKIFHLFQTKINFIVPQNWIWKFRTNANKCSFVNLEVSLKVVRNSVIQRFCLNRKFDFDSDINQVGLWSYAGYEARMEHCRGLTF